MYVCSDCDISRHVRIEHLWNLLGVTASIAEGSYQACSTTLPTGQVPWLTNLPAAAAIFKVFMSILCSWQLMRSSISSSFT